MRSKSLFRVLLFFVIVGTNCLMRAMDPENEIEITKIKIEYPYQNLVDNRAKIVNQIKFKFNQIEQVTYMLKLFGTTNNFANKFVSEKDRNIFLKQNKDFAKFYNLFCQMFGKLGFRYVDVVGDRSRRDIKKNNSSDDSSDESLGERPNEILKDFKILECDNPYPLRDNDLLTSWLEDEKIDKNEQLEQKVKNFIGTGSKKSKKKKHLSERLNLSRDVLDSVKLKLEMYTTISLECHFPVEKSVEQIKNTLTEYSLECHFPVEKSVEQIKSALTELDKFLKRKPGKSKCLKPGIKGIKLKLNDNNLRELRERDSFENLGKQKCCVIV